MFLYSSLVDKDNDETQKKKKCKESLTNQKLESLNDFLLEKKNPKSWQNFLSEDSANNIDLQQGSSSFETLYSNSINLLEKTCCNCQSLRLQLEKETAKRQRGLYF